MTISGDDLYKLVGQAATDLTGKRYSKKDAMLMVEAVTWAIERAMANGDEVKIYGFGKFRGHEYEPRAIVHFDKQPGVIPSHKIPKFAPGQRMRRAATEGKAPKAW